MKKSNSLEKKDPFVKWLLLGIPILFLVASPLHFVYHWTGENIIAGLLTPVNESPWEHQKLTFWPILIWWVVGFLIFGNKKEHSLPRFLVSCAVAESICILFVIAFFYTYTGAFEIESLIIDIVSLFLGLLSSIMLAIHVYRYSNQGALATAISFLIILLIAGAILFFTFITPHIPLFKDPPTGTYSIYGLL